MGSLSLPVRYGFLGIFFGLAAVSLYSALGQELDAPWWAIIIPTGGYGYVAGLIKQRRNK